MLILYTNECFTYLYLIGCVTISAILAFVPIFMVEILFCNLWHICFSFHVFLHSINNVNRLSLSFFPFTAYLNGYGSWETISYASGPEGGCCLFRYLWLQIIQNGSCYTGCYFIESGFEQYGMNIFVFSLANNEMIFVHIKWLSIP